MMRRILMLLTVALMMAAMMLIMAMPAFAQSPVVCFQEQPPIDNLVGPAFPERPPNVIFAPCGLRFGFGL
jgi:hypothetical protein